MERWILLWILGLVAIIPGRAALDLAGNRVVSGIWRAAAILPCEYEPSPDFRQLKVTWKFFQVGEAPRSIMLRDASGDHTFLAEFRDRIDIATNPPGDVSLHIKELEMTDMGSYLCLVEWEAQNMSRITREKTVRLKVAKVPASKPVITASSRESVLPSRARISLTCSASGSPPINYQWYKEGPGKEAEDLRRGAVLAFDGLQVSDSARYFCTAENRLNVQKEQSDAFQLTVEDAPGVSTAGPGAESGGHSTETGTPVWNFASGTSRWLEGTHPRTDGMVTSPTAFGNSSGQQRKTPGPQKKTLPLYLIILMAVLSAAFILMVISVVFCRRRTKNDNVYDVTYSNNALALGSEDIPASPGVNGTCLYENPNSCFGNNYTMEPTTVPGYVAMGEKMDNEYENLAAEKKSGV